MHPSLSNMDLLTQLDKDIDLLLKIMSSSIAYISRKAKHQQLPQSAVPLTILGKTEAVEPEVMDESIQELVEDLVTKAREIQEIILHIPDDNLGDDAALVSLFLALLYSDWNASAEMNPKQKELEHLEAEMKEANVEYRKAVKEAGEWRAR